MSKGINAQGYLEDPESLNIKYDYIRPVSESSVEEVYHFENLTLYECINSEIE